ncbi:MAG: PmoA family protein [Candidatus Hydrogenedentes bacterium]|nr:PmoA family protein [Candidatus Hydrogenedentota bacterium]
MAAISGAADDKEAWLDAQAARPRVAARIEDTHVAIDVDGKPFTCYTFAATQKYPYFWPVNGPVSGKSVTTETSEPYPHHHSLFFGCDRVNGGNYWQEANERGQIVSQGPALVEDSGDRVVFTDECLWQQPGNEPVLRDRRTVTVSAPSDVLRLIDFEIALEPLVDVRIEKTNHSLFSARVMPELSVKSGGTLINAEGKSGEKGTWGVASPWCDYAGTRDGLTEGLAILQHPGNRWYPAPWFTRDYGFFSPTPMYWPDGDGIDLPKGEQVVLRYRVAVHAGDASEAGIKRLWSEYERSAGAE